MKRRQLHCIAERFATTDAPSKWQTSYKSTILTTAYGWWSLC